jgi:hypothetical protein
MTPPADASEWIDGEPADPFLSYGGKDARLRVIPVVRKESQTNPNGLFVNCTSSDDEDEKRLSPFSLGPCRLYGNFTAQRMENAWQFSKVYPDHIGADGKPMPEYFEWAAKGWSSWKAERYPMGKEAHGKEVFHWWDGQPLEKVEARKRIYVPLYAEQVVQEQYFQWLKNVWEEDIKPDVENSMYLMDFDANNYEYGTMSLSEILNNPAKSMGHGFVLAMLLTNDAALKECQLR